MMDPATLGLRDEIFPALGAFQGKNSHDKEQPRQISSGGTGGTVGTHFAYGEEGCEARLENELGLGQG